MKLEVGMYVRLNCNYELGIGKTIGEIDEDNFIKTKFKDDFECSLPTYMITKASHNIYELLEEHDYIRIITSAFFEPIYYSYGKLVIRDDIPIENYSNNFIVEVITHEQMESMSYKVGE